MIPKPYRVALTTAAALVPVAAVLAPATATADDDYSKTTTSELISGTSPGSGKIVRARVLVLPPPSPDEKVGDTRRLLEVDADLDASSGVYSLSVDPTDVSGSYIENQGVVDFMVDLTDSKGVAWSTTFSARGIRTSSNANARRSTEQTIAWAEPSTTSTALVASKANKYAEIRPAKGTFSRDGKLILARSPGAPAKIAEIKIGSKKFARVELPKIKNSTVSIIQNIRLKRVSK